MSTAPSAAKRAEDCCADHDRRLDEAASILAETLLDMWRRERRARHEEAIGGAS